MENPQSCWKFLIYLCSYVKENQRLDEERILSRTFQDLILDIPIIQKVRTPKKDFQDHLATSFKSNTHKILWCAECVHLFSSCSIEVNVYNFFFKFYNENPEFIYLLLTMRYPLVKMVILIVFHSHSSDFFIQELRIINFEL